MRLLHLKTQLHAVNARWKRLSQLSFRLCKSLVWLSAFSRVFGPISQVFGPSASFHTLKSGFGFGNRISEHSQNRPVSYRSANSKKSQFFRALMPSHNSQEVWDFNFSTWGYVIRKRLGTAAINEPSWKKAIKETFTKSCTKMVS